MLNSNITAGLKEFNLIYDTTNPPLDIGTDYIWILSSRHGIDEEHVNCSKHSENYVPLSQTSQQECDTKDGFERIKLALSMGQKITAKRAHKAIGDLTATDYEQHAPIVLYNGWPKDNDSFIKAIPSLSVKGLPPYPASKIVIFDMPPHQPHTGGQFTSLVNLKDPRLQKMKVSPCNVSIVTSAYHIPRVRRLLTSNKYPNLFQQGSKIAMHGIDRTFERNCAKRDLEGESARLIKYFNEGQIGQPGRCAWYNEKSLLSWKPILSFQRTWPFPQQTSAHTPSRESVIDRYSLILPLKPY